MRSTHSYDDGSSYGDAKEADAASKTDHSLDIAITGALSYIDASSSDLHHHACASGIAA
jgi:hypothetical protein